MDSFDLDNNLSEDMFVDEEEMYALAAEGSGWEDVVASHYNDQMFLDLE